MAEEDAREAVERPLAAMLPHEAEPLREKGRRYDPGTEDPRPEIRQSLEGLKEPAA